MTRWKEPIIGFASAGDPLFLQLKQVVSSSHLLPEELLPGARSLIVFFIPFEESIVKSNISGSLASREWALAYIETNVLIAAIGERMKEYFSSFGYEVMVTPATHNFDPQKLISNWSHRHIGYIAGLGKFGLNNMLITSAGCCGRFGSFTTNMEFLPDIRPEGEACLYRYNGTCKTCINRCVGEALFIDESFRRHKCYEVCLRNEAYYQEIGKADVCGKCIVGLPCSFMNPVKR